MAYILSWRRKPNNEIKSQQFEELVKYIRENPGIRWKSIVSEKDTPINYLEIGVFKGENVIDVSKSYCKHPDARIYCVDPWVDYNEYTEYRGRIQPIYNEFVENMNKENLWNKIKVYRDFSHNVVPTLENNFFDISFIDGNHETEFVYKDAVMVLPKMKSGGTIIFDDYHWKETRMGINNFLKDYGSQLKNLRYNMYNLCVDKL